MRLQHIEEYKIGEELANKIQELLRASFSFYPERIYYKQVPDFRLLLWEDDSESNLLAHLAVEHRVISIDKEPVPIFGITDLCVAETKKSKGLASRLLDESKDIAKKHKIDFLVLFADDHRLYIREGYELIPNMCKWMMINEHQTLGIVRRSLADCLMVKRVGRKKWKTGEIDMMGTVF